MAVNFWRRIISFLLLAALAAGTVACRSRDEKSDARQQHIESMMTILVQVQKNLGRIRQKEAVVERLSSNVEGREQKSAEAIGKDIYENIRFIDSTIAASKNLVSRLEKENQSNGYRVVALDRMLQEMKKEIETKDREIASVKGEVGKLNKEVSRLMSTVDVLDEFINDQEDRISKAYIVSGTADELVSKGILASQGPISRILGSNYALETDFDIRRFRTIDITENRDFFFEKPLKRLRIITPHTRGSYELVGGDTSSLLLIKDENEFWKKSRCLVIVVE